MGLLDYLVKTIGTIDPNSGERVRVRKRPNDDWGNTYEVVERKDNASGEWKEGPTVPGSVSGGHY